MVRPHLEYGNTIWGPYYFGHVRTLESVQRRATQMGTSLRDKPYEECLSIVKLPSLAYRRRRGDMILMYKIMNGMVRLLPVDSLFKPAACPRTREALPKTIQAARTKVRTS